MPLQYITHGGDIMTAEIRDTDCHGSGAYLAPRGERNGKPRLHIGVDPIVPHLCQVLSGCTGRVTKVGYPYSDDLSYRYVQVTSSASGMRLRYFYLLPSVKVGDDITCGDVIGRADDITKRYPGITPHVHFEILDDSGNAVNPLKWMRFDDTKREG